MQNQAASITNTTIVNPTPVIGTNHKSKDNQQIDPMEREIQEILLQEIERKKQESKRDIVNIRITSHDLDYIQIHYNDEKADRVCVICTEKDRNCVFIPCGHVCCCHNCAIEWKKKQGTLNMKCFICKKPVTQISPIFLP